MVTSDHPASPSAGAAWPSAAQGPAGSGETEGGSREKKDDEDEYDGLARTESAALVAQAEKLIETSSRHVLQLQAQTAPTLAAWGASPSSVRSGPPPLPSSPSRGPPPLPPPPTYSHPASSLALSAASIAAAVQRAVPSSASNAKASGGADGSAPRSAAPGLSAAARAAADGPLHVPIFGHPRLPARQAAARARGGAVGRRPAVVL